ncbi:MAG: hypothetical protein ABFD54_05945 [Armatimonadota bacterium]|nr:hypothetical protein [bacterium]
MLAVTGNTYAVRDKIKQLGGQWDSANKRWLCPDEYESALRAIRIPVGGAEQLWEPCSQCGNEPVDGSGLCEDCRRTEALRIEHLLSVEDEARELIADMSNLAIALYNHVSRRDAEAIDAPANTRIVGHGSPLAGGYSVDLITDGAQLYARYNHHYDWDHDRYYVIPTDHLKPAYKTAVEMLIRSVAND